MNDAPAAKKHSNTPPSAEIKEQEGTKHIAKEDEDEDEKEEDEVSPTNCGNIFGKQIGNVFVFTICLMMLSFICSCRNKI